MSKPEGVVLITLITRGEPGSPNSREGAIKTTGTGGHAIELPWYIKKALLQWAGYGEEDEDAERNAKGFVKVRTNGDYSGWLSLSWHNYDRDIYDKARSIKESRWDKPSVVIPMRCYDQVLDFAEIMGFYVSNPAKVAIEIYKQRESSGSKLENILHSSREIIDDLRDDDEPKNGIV